MRTVFSLSYIVYNIWLVRVKQTYKYFPIFHVWGKLELYLLKHISLSHFTMKFTFSLFLTFEYIQKWKTKKKISFSSFEIDWKIYIVCTDNERTCIFYTANHIKLKKKKYYYTSASKEWMFFSGSKVFFWKLELIQCYLLYLFSHTFIEIIAPNLEN